MNYRSAARVGAILGAMSLLASPALADKASGWAKWMARAQSIATAMEAGDGPALHGACNGVTGTVVGQGFQFPSWGQSLIQVCTAYKNAFDTRETTRRAFRKQCGDIRRVGTIMGKAEAVAEGPGADVLARRIGELMITQSAEPCAFH